MSDGVKAGVGGCPGAESTPMSKKPRRKYTPVVEKVPGALPEPNFRKLNPAWRLKQMEMIDPFGWHKVKSEQLLRIHKRLSSFETMTWGEILGPDNHAIPVVELCKEARDRLSALGLDDQETLMSLRVSSTERVWGILEYNVLIILWWDPNHLVCPSVKKHT